MAAENPKRQPAYFLTHGGGPMPLMNDPGQITVTQYFKKLKGEIGEPSAIIVFSGHWEAPVPTVQTSAKPPMLYDYHGFPAETYKYQYSAPGAPAHLQKRVSDLLKAAGFDTAEDAKRGYDHGVFVPLLLISPEAKIPTFEVSLLSSMDPAAHFRMGKALAPLRDEGVLFIGSGSSYHNMRGFFAGDGGKSIKDAKAFDKWLVDVCTNKAYSAEQREQLLNDWAKAPAGRLSHPREEHLLPLMVIAGTALGAAGEHAATEMMGFPGSHFKFT